MMASPRLCIGIPVYNGGSLLFEMLESLVTQTFTDFEIVISDNASTDDTSEIVRRFANVDKRIRYHRNEINIGAAPNFNKVFELAGNPTYFKWAACDDLYKPTYLERCVDVLDKEPGVVLSYTIVDVIDETGENLLSKHPFYWRGCMESYTDQQGRTGWMMGPLHVVETTDVARRYYNFLERMIANFSMFGVIRTDALHRSSLIRSYPGSDRSLLAQLVLQGRFRQVDERLYVNRYHKSVGRLVPKKQQQAWMDTRRSPRLPMLQGYIDLIRAPLTARLGILDAARCFGVAVYYLTDHCARRALARASSSCWDQARGDGKPVGG